MRTNSFIGKTRHYLLIEIPIYCLDNMYWNGPQINSSPPSATYMRQWIGVGSDNGLPAVRRQAII